MGCVWDLVFGRILLEGFGELRRWGGGGGGGGGVGAGA